MHKLLSAFLILSVFLISCKQHKEKKIKQAETSNDFVSYAKGFSYNKTNIYTKVSCFNPWHKAGNVSFDYYLVDKDAEIPHELKDKNVIRTPIKKIICLSTTHIAFLDFIDELTSIVGISGANYVSNPKLQKAIKNEQIIDVGYGTNMDYESIVALQPDIVMAYGVESESVGHLHKIESLGIPVVFNAEYLENTPLGKAEWVKFVSAFYGKENIATEKLEKIALNYIQLKNTTIEIKNKPSVFFNIPWKGTWYVPGGKSYMACMVKDAGAKYIWGSDESHESLALSFESILANAKDADFWLHPGQTNQLSDIDATDNRLTEFKAYKNNKVFNNNALQTPGGGNDFWESGIMHPDIILRDLIWVFHPKSLPGYSPVYYKKLP